jgi:hypothetical protein
MSCCGARGFNSVPHGVFYRDAEHMTYSRISEEKQRSQKEKKKTRQNSNVFYNIIAELTMQHFYHILWARQTNVIQCG